MTDEANIDTSYQINKQKLILIGDVAVGKTSIINSILGQKFNDEYEPSIGVDFFSKTIKYKGKSIKLQIWDSAGQEKFRSLIPNYIRGASLIILVYDITNKSSFNNLNSWIEFINNYESTNIIICGNKIDLKDKREVSYEEGEKFSEEKKMDFFEISAKEETNLLNMLFSSVASLPFFSTLNNEIKSKEELINDLEKENIDNLNNNEDETLGIGNEAKDKKLNVIGKEKKNISNLVENNIDNSDINKVIEDSQNNNKVKKKRKCC
jgi:Ras-related protein Rab-6A